MIAFSESVKAADYWISVISRLFICRLGTDLITHANASGNVSSENKPSISEYLLYPNQYLNFTNRE